MAKFEETFFRQNKEFTFSAIWPAALFWSSLVMAEKFSCSTKMITHSFPFSSILFKPLGWMAHNGNRLERWCLQGFRQPGSDSNDIQWSNINAQIKSRVLFHVRLTHKNLASLLGKLVKSLTLHLEDFHIEGKQVLPETKKYKKKLMSNHLSIPSFRGMAPTRKAASTSLKIFKLIKTPKVKISSRGPFMKRIPLDRE